MTAAVLAVLKCCPGPWPEAGARGGQAGSQGAGVLPGDRLEAARAGARGKVTWNHLKGYVVLEFKFDVLPSQR